MKFVEEIDNMQPNCFNYGDYYDGFYQCRDEATVIASKADERINELEEALRAFVNWKTNEEGTLSLVDDEELWKRAEEVLNK